MWNSDAIVYYIKLVCAQCQHRYAVLIVYSGDCKCANEQKVAELFVS